MALILETITVQDFGGAYGPDPQVFRFGGRGPVAVVGNNGAGKSTGTAVALVWALFGKGPPKRAGSGTKAVAGKGVMRPGAAPRVEVVFRDGDELITLARWRDAKGGGDRVALTRSGTTTTPEQVELDALVGGSYDLFVRTVVHGQGDVWSFAEATDGRKREVLDAITGAEMLGASYETANAHALRTRQQADALRKRAEDANRRASAIDPAAMQRAAERWDAWQADRLAQADAELRQAQQAVADAEAAEAAGDAMRLGRAAAEASRAHTPRPELDMRPYNRAVEQALAPHNQAQQAATAARAHLQQVEHAKVGAPCPTCGQRVQPDAPVALRRAELAAALQPLQEQVQATALALQRAQAQQEQAQAWLRDAEAAWRQQDAQWAAHIANLPQPPAAGMAAAARRALEAVQARHRDQAQAQNPHVGAVQALQREQQALQREAAQLEEAAAAADREAAVAAAWAETLHPRGVRAYLAESALYAIEAEANRWLSVLSNGQLQLGFAAVKETAKGGAREEITTTVRSRGADGTLLERDPLTCSGGEQRRLNLAVDLGVAAVFARGGALRLSLLVLDEECLSGLDEVGKRAVVVALHHAGVADVVVVEHDRAAVGLFERRIVVERTPPGFATVREEGP